MERYKRSKTDSALYCPYCGRGFNMSYERYRAYSDAKRKGLRYAITACRACKKDFYFRNCTPQFVRETGIKAVMTLERGNMLGYGKAYTY